MHEVAPANCVLNALRTIAAEHDAKVHILLTPGRELEIVGVKLKKEVWKCRKKKYR